MQIETGCVMNSIFWLSSPRPDEVNMVEVMMDDVSTICVLHGIPFTKHIVQSRADLINVLDKIAEAARQGCRPLVYLDMHGDAVLGVEVAASGEVVPWDSVVSALKEINRGTCNNLVVVAAVCWGLYAIKQAAITELTPFFILIAPERRITFGDLMRCIFPFFQDLTTDWDLTKAYDSHLSAHMRMYHCHRIFTVSMARYILNSCKGAGGSRRRERLLTEVLKSGYPATRPGLREARQAVKEGTKPTQSMLEKYAGVFLGGRPLGYDIDELLELVDKAAAELARYPQATARNVPVRSVT